MPDSLRLLTAAALVCLSACGTSAPTDSSPDTADVADTADSGGGDTAPACVTVTPGEDWGWRGECPGMGTPVAILVDGCHLTLDYDAVGGMTMGMPRSGDLVGDAVTFADDNSVKGCTGTVLDADSIEGTCGDGCTYTLKR